jgi:hypothetical protein
LPVLPPTITLHVSGIASDDDGLPVTGATVTVTLPAHPGFPHPVVSAVTDGRGSYSVDVDAFDEVHQSPFAQIDADSPDHDRFYASLRWPSDSQQKSVSQNVRLYRIRRITAGELTFVTVRPGDTLCGDDDELVCRFVHVLVPSTGVLTMSCDPHIGERGGPGFFIVGYNNYFGEDLPWPLMAGSERIVQIGMWFSSTVSQSCTLKTSLAP